MGDKSAKLLMSTPVSSESDIRALISLELLLRDPRESWLWPQLVARLILRR